MASLLTRIRRGEDIWRGMTLNQYLQRIVDARLSQGYLPPIPQFGVNGQPVEKIPPSFETYAQDIYAAHPVIFGLMEARRSVFSEARFCWRSVRNGNPGDVLPINDGLELLERPWEGAQTGTLLSRMRQDADLGGTAFVVREEATAIRPARLRRLRPDWVHIVLSGDPWTDLDVDFLGIAYAPNGPDNQPVETFLPDQVAVWAPIPDPLAQFRGMSWLTPVIRELQADNAATQHKISTLKQGAWLGPIVVAPQGTSLEQFKKFVEAADARHAGPNNAGRMVFLAPGSEIQTVAQSLQQLDMKAISGAAETRIAVASRVPAVIAQISEGLQGSSLNTGNYQAAKRQWIDGSLRPDWRSLCEALSTIVPPPDLSQLDLEPGTTAQLWILESDIALLHQDRLEAAEVRQANATTINTLVTAGFEPASIVEAVRDDDLSRLKHTGLTSVQLTPPGMGGPGSVPGQEGQIPETQGEDAYQQALAELRAGGGVPAEEPVEAARSQILRADVDHTGAMIALVPTEDDARRLEVDDGEPVDELHLTLFHLGEAADIPADQRESIVDAVEAVVRRRNVPVLELNAFGAALWNPHGEEPAWVLNVGDPQQRPEGQEPLAVIRRAVGDALAYGVPEFRMARQHTPWQPHVCVAYGADTVDADELVDRTGPVTFDRIRVVFASRVTDIPLRGREQATRSAVESEEDGDEAEHYTTRARVPRDGDGDGKRAAYPGGPDIIPVTPRVPNPKPVTGRLRGEVDRPAPPRKVPPAKPPSRPMTPQEQRVADALAAGRISKSTAVALLTGRREPEGMDPDRARAFTVGMVHAGYITELAWTGNRERVEDYLRRQDTSTLRMAAPFFGLTLPADADHAAVVSAFADRAMQLEAPRRELPPVDEVRQSLMSRKVADLRAALRDAGLPVSGRKAELVDRLVAAYGAVRGGDGDTADRPDRGAGPAGRRDGRGRGSRAAGALDADREPDAGAAGPAAAGVGGGGDAGDLTGAGGLSPDPDVRAVQVENRIREAYAEAPKGARGWANIADIREHPGVRDVDRAEVDAALRRFATQSGAYLETEANQSALTDRDRAAAVRVGGENNHYLRLDDPSLRPLPTSTRPTTRPAKKATPRKATSRVTVSAGWLPGSPRPLSELSAEQAARAARENLVDPAAAAAHIRAQADEAEAAADLLRRPDTGPPDRPTGRQQSVPFGERDRQDSAVRREVEAERLRRLADRVEGGSPAPATPRQAPAAPATPAPTPPARPTKVTPAKRTPSLPSRPGRVSVADSRDWTPSQHVAHAEQARQRGDLAEARLHRGLADTKNRAIAEQGRGVEHLRSLTDRDDARRFLRSLTREQLNALAGQLGVDTTGSRDAVIARILRELFGG